MIGDDGNVAVITALLATTLFGFLALTIDVGALLIRQSSLQTGADAAAIAIARRCAHAVVTGMTSCTSSVAEDLMNANDLGGGDTVAVDVDLHSSYGGKVGRVLVRGSRDQRSFFSGVLDNESTRTVAATATARWGPLTASDAVFPLAICKGALPPVGQSVTLRVDPASSVPPACDGAPEEPAFGWLQPDDPSLCTTNISTVPTMYLDVQAAVEEPSSAGCQLEIDELHNDIDGTAVCHTTPNESEHCHGSSTAEDRKRTLVVYDPTSGLPAKRPTYALVSFEFTGARLADRASSSAGGWTGPCAPIDPTTMDDVQCIKGIVRNWVPPTDGPILDPDAALLLPDIDATTVLDVRLED